MKLFCVLLMLGFSMLLSSAQSLRGNLYNCWTFNDSVSGITGQPFMFVSPSYAPGKFGNGLHLTSNGPAASAVGTGPFIVDDADWTGMFWLRLNTLPVSDAIVLDNRNASSGFNIWIDSHGELAFYVLSYGYYAYSVHIPNLATNTDYLIIFGYNYTTQKSFLRVNDVQLDSVVFTASYTATKNITIGGGNPYSTCKFDGVVSLLTLWSGKVLASWEMQTLWNSGVGLNYPF